MGVLKEKLKKALKSIAKLSPLQVEDIHALEHKFNRQASVTLPNNLKLKYKPDPTSDSITLKMTVNVGANHDPANKAGLAHMLEHLLLLNGSMKRMEEGVNLRGGYMQGTTSRSGTVYTISLPRSDENETLLFKLGRYILTEFPITQQDVESERPVILSELHRFNDKYDGSIEEGLKKTGYILHHYEDTGGTEDTIQSITKEDIQSLHSKYYNASNTEIEISGIPLFSRTYKKIREWFGDLPAGESPPPSKFHAEYRGGYKHISSDDRQFYVQALLPIAPESPHNYTAMIDMCQQLMNKMLNERIRGQEQRYGYTGYASTQEAFWGKAMLATVEVHPEHAPKAISVLADVLKDIAAGNISDRDFLIARNLTMKATRDKEKFLVSQLALYPDKDVRDLMNGWKNGPSDINNISPQGLRDFMREMLKSPPTLVTKGPVEVPDAYARLCRATGAPMAARTPAAPRQNIHIDIPI